LEGDWGGREFVGSGEVEVLWKDSYDLVAGSGHENGFSGDGGVAVEESLPETVADDGDLAAAFDGFFREKVTAEGGLGAEDVEQVGLGDDSSDETGMIVVVEADADGSLLQERHVGKCGGLSAPDVFMTGVGSGVGPEFFEVVDFLQNDDEVAAVAVGEGFEENGVDDGEESGGGSNAQGEGEDGGDGEGGGLAELAEAVAEILQDGVHRFTSELGLVLASGVPIGVVWI
jgi:hypothetical protein